MKEIKLKSKAQYYIGSISMGYVDCSLKIKNSKVMVILSPQKSKLVKWFYKLDSLIKGEWIQKGVLMINKSEDLYIKEMDEVLKECKALFENEIWNMKLN